MEIRLAKKYGFCFGVKRAIKIAEKNKNSYTLGPLIHNYQEINRLQKDFNVSLQENYENIKDYDNIKEGSTLIVRTHGIPKDSLKSIKERNFNIVDATCPFVVKPQQIVAKMSEEGYQIIIFGDIAHPEIKGVMSYAKDVLVIGNLKDLQSKSINHKVALVSQTTKQIEKFKVIANYLMEHCYEVRIFNTICNATFDNQGAARELSKEVDVMIVVGGKTSSNTKQLLIISQENCPDSYLVENEKEIKKEWFVGKKICGITAGASTPDWIVQNVKSHIAQLDSKTK